MEYREGGTLNPEKVYAPSVRENASVHVITLSPYVWFISNTFLILRLIFFHHCLLDKIPPFLLCCLQSNNSTHWDGKLEEDRNALLSLLFASHISSCYSNGFICKVRVPSVTLFVHWPICWACHSVPEGGSTLSQHDLPQQAWCLFHGKEDVQRALMRHWPNIWP